MRYIAHREDLVPASLERAKRANVPWEEFTRSADGHALRQAKADEQGGLCGYCECRLTEPDGTLPPNKSRVDHFLSRNKGASPRPDLTYSWSNMVLSCMRQESCDTRKGRQGIPDANIINPREEDPRKSMTFVRVGESGHFRVLAVARDGAGRKRAQDTIDALGLNCDALAERRGSAWYMYAEEVANLQERPDRELVQALLQEMEENEFPSAMVALAQGLLTPCIV